jgi:catechol 2,3-dioxygenase-like lactoylglutathione lyase family enzyme
LSAGPVVGFAVRDLPAAVDELRRAGVELLGEPGPTWQHFRGPDGNVYELVTS